MTGNGRDRENKPKTILDYKCNIGTVHSLGKHFSHFSCQLTYLNFYNSLDNSVYNVFVLFLTINPTRHVNSSHKRRIIFEKLDITSFSHSKRKHQPRTRYTQKLAVGIRKAGQHDAS